MNPQMVHLSNSQMEALLVAGAIVIVIATYLLFN